MVRIPPISVVMVCYNSSEFIEEAIDSVLNQTFHDFEFIIVDDGSTDNTVDIIKKYIDDRIIYICNQHDYIDSLNTGMNRAKGHYIARMDSDDIIVNTRLELQYNFLEINSNVDVVMGWFDSFGGDTIVQRRPPIEHDRIVASLLTANILCHPLAMIRRSTLRRIFPNNVIYQKIYQYAEDYKLWVDIIKGGGIFYNLPEVLLKYRESDSQVIKTKRKEMFIVTQRVQGEYFQFILDSLANKVNTYNYLMNELIELYDKDNIDFCTLRIVLQRVYIYLNSTRKCN